MSEAAICLVTFDVDGTLIESEGESSNKMHKDAFAASFEKIFGLKTSIDCVNHHGMTDPLIIQSVLQHHNVSLDGVEAKMAAVQEAMVEHAQQAKGEAGAGLRALPGVEKLLNRLKAFKGFVVGLTTGNLEPIAWLKMEGLGLKGSFTLPLVGGFGSDYWGKDISKGGDDRAQLLRIARKRARKASMATSVKHIHVGDSPYDIQAAALSHCDACIGVTTVSLPSPLSPSLPLCLSVSLSLSRDTIRPDPPPTTA